jgi:hypothetical protein
MKLVVNLVSTLQVYALQFLDVQTQHDKGTCRVWSIRSEAALGSLFIGEL